MKEKNRNTFYKTNRFNIQFFAEEENKGDETGTEEKETDTEKKFTQSELDSIIQTRLIREKKKWEDDQSKTINDLVEKKLKEKETFQNMTEAERKDAELERIKDEYQAKAKELEDAQKELLLYQAKSEIKSAWSEDKLPTYDGMDSIVNLLALQDEDTKASCYKSLKKLCETVQAKVRKEEFNQDTPKSGSGGKTFATDSLLAKKKQEIESKKESKYW